MNVLKTLGAHGLLGACHHPLEDLQKSPAGRTTAGSRHRPSVSPIFAKEDFLAQRPRRIKGTLPEQNMPDLNRGFIRLNKINGGGDTTDD